MRYLLTCLFSLLLFNANAHQDTTLSVIRTSNVENLHFLPQNMHVFIDTNNNTPLQDIRGIMFLHLNEEPKRKPAKRLLIDSKIYLLFWIENNEKIARSFFITPGTFSTETILYTRDSLTNKWIEIPGQISTDKSEKSYRFFSIPAGKEMQILVRCKYARTNVSTLNPYLINPIFFDYHINFIHTHWFGVNTFTYVLCGLLLMMLLFSMANFLQNYKREFLYYSVYAFCMGTLLFLKASLYKYSTNFNFFHEEYLDYFLQMIGYIFYIGFTRMFLNTPIKYPTLNRIFIMAEFILGFFLVAFSILYFGGFGYPYLSATENASKFFLLFLAIMYVIFGIVERNRLMNYLLGGNISNLVFGGISQFMVLVPSVDLFASSGLFKQSLIYFEIGILLELNLFLWGLTYKNRIELIEKVKMKEALKLENERQEYEKEIAVLRAQQEERSRISADMHDELGSGVTAIRLLSEIARQKTKEHPIEEIPKISYNANELMTKMNAIIWSMNPGNDTINSLVAYIRSYASEYLDNFKMDYQIKLPSEIPNTEISGVRRRNIFLVLKESLNNVMKHAEATEVIIKIHFNKQMIIEISDNGKGMDSEKLNQFGNGLKNMQRRMESIAGKFEISSGTGTTVKLIIPIN